MNFSEMQSHLAYVLDFNDGQTSQAFSTSRLKSALNFAYTREVNKASLEGNSQFFYKVQDFIWPASAVTKTLPTNINPTAVLQFRDVTSDSNGLGNVILPFFKDNVTLQWGTTGPTEERTIRVWYVSRASVMSSDSDTPELIPAEYHELIVWSAACDLKSIGDEAAPAEWMQTRNEFRIDLWKYVSRGRPLDDVPQVYPEQGRFIGRTETYDSSENPTEDGSSLDPF